MVFYWGGSPPLTRGTLKSVIFFPALWRITPAYAGNTEATTRDMSQTKDHPRLRGEHREQA